MAKTRNIQENNLSQAARDLLERSRRPKTVDGFLQWLQADPKRIKDWMRPLIVRIANTGMKEQFADIFNMYDAKDTGNKKVGGRVVKNIVIISHRESRDAEISRIEKNQKAAKKLDAILKRAADAIDEIAKIGASWPEAEKTAIRIEELPLPEYPEKVKTLFDFFFENIHSVADCEKMFGHFTDASRAINALTANGKNPDVLSLLYGNRQIIPIKWPDADQKKLDRLKKPGSPVEVKTKFLRELRKGLDRAEIDLKQAKELAKLLVWYKSGSRPDYRYFENLKVKK